jgi:hypothetical protein
MGNAPRERPNSFVRATRALQDNVARSGPVAGASYSLIGTILLLGGGDICWTAGWREAVADVCGLLLGIVVASTS